MSLTTDNVRPSPHPNSWRIGRLTIAGFVMGLGQLAFCVAVLAVGDFVAGYEHRDLENARLRDPRLRQPGDDLQQSRETTHLVVAAKFVAHRLLGCRHVDRLRPRRDGDCDGASALLGGRGRARRRCRFRSSDGPCESPPVSPPFPHLSGRAIDSTALVDAIANVSREPTGAAKPERALLA